MGRLGKEWIARPKAWNILLPMNRAETPHRPVEALMAGEFDQGAGYTNWRPRGSGDWLLIYTVDGCGSIAVGGTAHSLIPGEAVLFSPGAAQDYRTDESAGRWRLRWAHFQPRPNWRAWIRWPEVARGVGWLALPQGDVRIAFEDALGRTVAALRAPHGDAPEFGLNALEEALLWAQRAGEGNPHQRLDERVRKAMDYLAARPAEPFRLDALAKHCGLSESRLSHLFREQTGETPQVYSEELRLRLAQQLLVHSGLRVNEVAAETGFTDSFYFAKRFRKFAKCSPTEYRTREARR
jgi:AraC family transcriptional regulator of arabinose operon